MEATQKTMVEAGKSEIVEVLNEIKRLASTLALPLKSTKVPSLRLGKINGFVAN